MPGLLDPFGGADPSSLLGDPQQQGLLGFLAGLQKSGALNYEAPFLSGRVPGGFAAGLAGGAGGLLAARDAYANRAKSLAETQLVGAQIPKVQAEAAYLKGKTDFATQLMGLLGGGRSAAPGPSMASTAGSATSAPADSIFSPPAAEEPETASPASAAPSAPVLPIKPAIAPGTELGIGGAVGGGGNGWPFPNLGPTKEFPALPENPVNTGGFVDKFPPITNLTPDAYGPGSPFGRSPPQGLIAAAGGGQLPASPLVRAAQAAPAPSAPTPTMGSGLNLRNLPPEVLFGMAGDIMGFPSLGQLLTGTPSYKGAVAGAEQTGRNTSDLRFKPAIEGSTETAKNPALIARAQGEQAAIGNREINVERAKLGLEPIRDQNSVLKEEYQKNVVEPFNSAQKAMVPLTAIENAMSDFRTGPTAENRLRLQRGFEDVASLIRPTDPETAKKIAAGEIITKEGTTLGFELARTLGSREAQMIVQQAIASNPGLANSPGGNEKLIALIKSGLQRDIDKRAFVDQWFNKNLSYAGATEAFNKVAPVEKYVSQVLPFQPKNAADYDKLPAGTRYIKDGQIFEKRTAR